MSYLTGIVSDLREKRLWPVALVLLVGLVAIPLLLSHSSHPVAASQQAQAAPPPAASALPTVSVSSSAASGHPKGQSRDPFTQPHGSGSGPATDTAVATSAGATAAPAGPTSTGAAGGAGTSSTVTSAGGASTPSSSSPGASTGPAGSLPTSGSTPALPSGSAKPAPVRLTATESYAVSLAITNDAGGFDTTDPLERLSVLPSDQQPLLVELGVLEGGRRVLFAVQPGAVVGGPGTCIPGPIDCQVLSLARGQIEKLSRQTADGVVPVDLFAVTAIAAVRHSSQAAAEQARRTASAAGRRLLGADGLSVLSLFQYRQDLGVLVDLRNLKVGGS